MTDSDEQQMAGEDDDGGRPRWAPLSATSDRALRSGDRTVGRELAAARTEKPEHDAVIAAELAAEHAAELAAEHAAARRADLALAAELAALARVNRELGAARTEEPEHDAVIAAVLTAERAAELAAEHAAARGTSTAPAADVDLAAFKHLLGGFVSQLARAEGRITVVDARHVDNVSQLGDQLRFFQGRTDTWVSHVDEAFGVIVQRLSAVENAALNLSSQLASLSVSTEDASATSVASQAALGDRVAAVEEDVSAVRKDVLDLRAATLDTRVAGLPGSAGPPRSTPARRDDGTFADPHATDLPTRADDGRLVQPVATTSIFAVTAADDDAADLAAGTLAVVLTPTAYFGIYTQRAAKAAAAADPQVAPLVMPAWDGESSLERCYAAVAREAFFPDRSEIAESWSRASSLESCGSARERVRDFLGSSERNAKAAAAAAVAAGGSPHNQLGAVASFLAAQDATVSGDDARASPPAAAAWSPGERAAHGPAQGGFPPSYEPSGWRPTTLSPGGGRQGTQEQPPTSSVPGATSFARFGGDRAGAAPAEPSAFEAISAFASTQGAYHREISVQLAAQTAALEVANRIKRSTTASAKLHEASKVLHVKVSRRSSQAFILARFGERPTLAQDLWGFRAVDAVLALSGTELWNAGVRCKPTYSAVMCLILVRLGGVARHDVTLNPADTILLQEHDMLDIQPEHDVARVQLKRSKAADPATMAEFENLLEAQTSLFCALYGEGHRAALEHSRRRLRLKNGEDNVRYSLAWCIEDWQQLQSAFVQCLSGLLGHLNVTDDSTDDEVAAAAARFRLQPPRVRWEDFPEAKANRDAVWERQSARAITKLVAGAKTPSPGGPRAGGLPADLLVSCSLKRDMASAQEALASRRAAAAGSSPPPPPPGASVRPSKAEAAAVRAHLKKKGDKFYQERRGTGTDGDPLPPQLACLRCHSHDGSSRCDNPTYIHGLPPPTAEDLQKCPALLATMLCYGGPVTGQVVLRSARPAALVALRARAAGRGAHGFTSTLSPHAPPVRYPLGDLGPREQPLRSLMEAAAEKTAAGWLTEVKATPSHRRWGKFEATSASLEIRELMRAIDILGVFNGLSNDLHTQVANMVLDCFFVGGVRSSEEATLVTVIGFAARALSVVAARGASSTRAEARAALARSPFAAHAPAPCAGAASTPAFVHTQHAAHGGGDYVQRGRGSLVLPLGVHGRTEDGGQVIAPRTGSLIRKCCVITATSIGLRNAGFIVHDADLWEELATSAEKLHALVKPLAGKETLSPSEALVRRVVHDVVTNDAGGAAHDMDVRVFAVLADRERLPSMRDVDVVAFSSGGDGILSRVHYSVSEGGEDAPAVYLYIADNHAIAFLPDMSDPAVSVRLATRSSRQRYLASLTAAGHCDPTHYTEAVGGVRLIAAAAKLQEPQQPVSSGVLYCHCCNAFDSLSARAPRGGARETLRAGLGSIVSSFVGGLLSMGLPGLTAASLSQEPAPSHAESLVGAFDDAPGLSAAAYGCVTDTVATRAGVEGFFLPRAASSVLNEATLHWDRDFAREAVEGVPYLKERPGYDVDRPNRLLLTRAALDLNLVRDGQARLERAVKASLSPAASSDYGRVEVAADDGESRGPALLCAVGEFEGGGVYVRDSSGGGGARYLDVSYAWTEVGANETYGSTGFVGRRLLIVLSAAGRRAGAADDGGGDLPAPLGAPLEATPPGAAELEDDGVVKLANHLVTVQRAGPTKPTAEWLQAGMRATSALVRACGSVEAADHVHTAVWERRVGRSMQASSMDALAPFVSQGQMHWNQVVATRGADLQYQQGLRRRRQCKEPLATADQMKLLWDGVWGDFVEGRVLLLPSSEAQLVESPEDWAIPNAGLAAGGAGEGLSYEYVQGSDPTREGDRPLEDVLGASRVHEHRMLAVEKRDEHGVVDANKVRTIHHQSESCSSARSRVPSKAESVNGGTSKYWFPRVRLPTMATLVLQLAAMSFFFPLAAILISVKDVDAAFRRIKVRSRDVCLNATRIGGVIAIYQYLSFGFAGSPGIFSEVSSGPLTAHHKGHAPEDPRWHGSLSFFSAAFVDDSALLAYKFGLLKYLSECCFLTGLCALFGYHGLNVAKDAKVGPWKETQHVWGLTFDTRRRTIGMSPERLARAARALEDAVWARGNLRVQLLAVQQLAGSTRWYCQANRAMRAAQNDIVRMLSTDDPARKWVSPRGSESYKRWCWANLWDACELLRVGLNDVEQWHAPYISTFLGALPPEFRLAFPEELAKLVVLGGDAMPTMLFGINWRTKEAFYLAWTMARQVALETVLRATGCPSDLVAETIISVQELLVAIVCFAESCASGVRDSLHMAAVDNTNAVAWISKRMAANLYVSFILKLLSWLESLSGNELGSVWVATANNVVPDNGSRIVVLGEDEIVTGHADLLVYLASVDPEIVLVDLSDIFDFYFLDEWNARSLRVHTEPLACFSETLAASRRVVPGERPAVLDLGGASYADLTGGAGPFAAAAQSRGAEIGVLSAGTPEERFLQRARFRGSRARYVGPGAGPGEVLGPALRRQVRAASLRAWPGLTCAELEAALAQFPNLTSVVVELAADVSIVDADSAYNRVVLALGALDYEVSTFSLLATELGDTLAHARLVVLGESRALVAALGEPDGVSSQTTTQRAVRGIMAPPVSGVRSGVFVPSLGADRGASRPRRVGYLLGNSGARTPVYSDVRGGDPDPRALYWDSSVALAGGGRGAPRRLTAVEYWCAQGLPSGLLDSWRLVAAGDAGVPPPTDGSVVAVAAASTSAGLAESVVAAQLGRLSDYMAIRRTAGGGRAAGPPIFPVSAHAERMELDLDDSWMRCGALGAHGDNECWRPLDADGVDGRASSFAYLSDDHATSLACPLDGRASSAEVSAPVDADLGGRAWALRQDDVRRTCGDTALIDVDCRGADRGDGSWRAGAPLRLLFENIHTSGYGVDDARCSLTEEQQATMRAGRRSLAFSSLASSTVTKYSGCWNRYVSTVENLFGSTVGPWLDGASPRAEEDLLLDFVVYLCFVRNFAHSTICGYLCAVRWVHLSHGFVDPLLGKPRLTLARRAVKRTCGPPQGKVPASPDMLRNIHGHLVLTTPFGVCLWGGLMLAFFFLLRSSEYASSGGFFDTSRALLVGDVAFYRAGEPVVDWWIADEVTLVIRASKTDQQRLGVCRNAYATGALLCPVKAAAAVMELRKGAAADEPLLLHAPGVTISREDITRALRWAARDVGQDEKALSTHSLRIGGASCMLAEGYSEEDIRRQGRWHSFCWRRYAYDSRERMQGVSRAMATSTYTVMQAGQDFLHRRRGA